MSRSKFLTSNVLKLQYFEVKRFQSNGLKPNLRRSNVLEVHCFKVERFNEKRF